MNPLEHELSIPYPYPDAPDAVRDCRDRIRISEEAFVAPGAVLLGDVTVSAGASIWYQAVLRGDVSPIRIGEESNIQDGTIVHGDYGVPAVVGKRVTVGHRVLLHACNIGDDAVIGMGAVVLSRARIGAGAVIAAGAVVREGTVVGDGEFWAGVPAERKAMVRPEWRERFELNWKAYVNAAFAYRTVRGAGVNREDSGGESSEKLR